MEKPKHFGLVRRAGVLQDTAFQIFQELERTDLTAEQRFKYFELLAQLSMKVPSRRMKTGKKPKRVKKKVEESDSAVDWSKKIGGE